MLASHDLVPPALTAILEGECQRVQAFLAPGHVCAITGARPYDALAARYRPPVVVTGFHPDDILGAIERAVAQLESGSAEVENQYARGAREEGNPIARELVDEVFELTDRTWRGMGSIPSSGLRIRPEYAAHDAERIFEVPAVVPKESPSCSSGFVLRGRKKPCE